MLKNKGFEILISSDLQFEELCSEIYFDGEFVALITREEGLENAILHIELPKKTVHWTFDLEDFLKILKSAKDNLIKTDEQTNAKKEKIKTEDKNFSTNITTENQLKAEILHNKKPCFSIYKHENKYLIKILKADLSHFLGFRLNDVISVLEKSKEGIAGYG